MAGDSLMFKNANNTQSYSAFSLRLPRFEYYSFSFGEVGRDNKEGHSLTGRNNTRSYAPFSLRLPRFEYESVPLIPFGVVVTPEPIPPPPPPPPPVISYALTLDGDLYYLTIDGVDTALTI